MLFVTETKERPHFVICLNLLQNQIKEKIQMSAHAVKRFLQEKKNESKKVKYTSSRNENNYPT